jgi:hypothetical protein
MPQSTNQNWKPPDRLAYSSLRPVRLSGQGKFLAVVVGLMLIGGFALGIFLARTVRREAQAQRLLDQQGVTTDAVVTRLWRTGDKENAPRVSYRFDCQGAICTNSARAPLVRWRGLKVGDRLPVRFVPSQPSISHPVDWAWKGLPFWIPYFATAMLAGIAALLAFQLARQMRLLAEGRAVPGRITAIRKAKGLIVLYEFEVNGAKIKGRAHVRKMPPPGDPVCVLYDLENPRRNAIYPLEMVRLDD